MSEALNQIKLIALNEAKQVKGWFREQLLTKLVVLLGFAGLAVLVAGFIWLWSWGYMSNLAQYENYGELTALYLIKAGLLVIAWLGLGSAVTSNLTRMANKNAEMEYLLVLPVRKGVLAFWGMVKTVLMNWVLVLVGLLPLMLAYFMAFDWGVNATLVGRVLLVGLVMAMMVTAVGSGLVYTTGRWWVRIRGGVSVIGVLGFFGVSTWLILKVIFPEQLKTLYSSEIEQFMNIYTALPLLSEWWPSSWMAAMVFDFAQNWWVLTVSGLMMVIAWLIEKETMRSLWQLSQEREDREKRYGFNLLKNGGLVKKDIIGVLRTPTEWGYGVLLMGMAVAFFVLLGQATKGSYWSRKFEVEIMVAALGWLLFFVTAFGLRVVFPLMAREGKVSWWLMSIGMGRGKIIGDKLKAALILGLPLVLISSLVWLIMPFEMTRLLWMFAFTGVLVISLVLLLNLWGMISPLFKLADQPDKVSTSMSGLMALGVSLIIIAWSVFTANKALENGNLDYLTIVAGVGMGTLMVGVSYWLARMRISKYEF